MCVAIHFRILRCERKYLFYIINTIYLRLKANDTSLGMCIFYIPIKYHSKIHNITEELIRYSF